MEIFFPPSILALLVPFFGFFSIGNDEAVADTNRRVGGALARKSALKNRLNDAIKRLQATERGKDHRQELKLHLFIHWD